MLSRQIIFSTNQKSHGCNWFKSICFDQPNFNASVLKSSIFFFWSGLVSFERGHTRFLVSFFIFFIGYPVLSRRPSASFGRASAKHPIRRAIQHHSVTGSAMLNIHICCLPPPFVHCECPTYPSYIHTMLRTRSTFPRENASLSFFVVAIKHLLLLWLPD